MDVIISIDVRRTIEEYANALMYYPITRNRARQKVDNLTAALEALGSSVVTPGICMSKDLLQAFDANSYNYEKGTITIMKMMAATFVKESVEKLMRPILEFNERLMAI